MRPSPVAPPTPGCRTRGGTGAGRNGCPPSRPAVWRDPRGREVTGGSPQCGAGRALGNCAENARSAQAWARSRPAACPACAALSACCCCCCCLCLRGQFSFNPRRSATVSVVSLVLSWVSGGPEEKTGKIQWMFHGPFLQTIF